MSQALEAHSLAEAYLYLMARSCLACQKGLLNGADAKRLPDDNEAVIAIESTCASCGDKQLSRFQIPDGQLIRQTDPPVINSTDQPSRIIDLVQWLALFRMITESASLQRDKVQARYLGLEAALCLEEAMKFFVDESNDLAPPDAFFTESSRQRLLDNPNQFTRQRLVNLRSKLPTTNVMRANIVAENRARKKSWWRKWLP